MLLSSFPDNQPSLARWGIIFLYALVTGVTLAYHEPWRDETHSWLIVQLSDSLPDLFVNKAYEGHPMLWYLLLYAVKEFIGNSFPDAQILNWLLSVGAVCLLVQFSSFSLPVKILLTFSYFLSFEYAILARNYAVAIVLLFAVCSLFRFRHQHWPYLAICGLLALLFQASAYALIIGACLYVTLLAELVLFRWSETLKQWGLYTTGAVTVGVGALISLLSIIPPPDMGFPYPKTGGHDYVGITSTLAGIWNALVPIPGEFFHFWNTNILDSIDHSLVIKCALMLGIIGLVIIPLFRSRLAVAGWLLSALLMLYVLDQYRGSLRHYGHFIISLIVFLWIQSTMADFGRARHPAIFLRLAPIANRLWIGLLVLQVIATGIAVNADLRWPFSMNQKVAQYMQSSPVRNWFWAGDVDHSVEGIAAYLPNHRMYYPRSGQQNGFMLWTTRRKRLTLEQVIDSVRTRQTGTTLFVYTLPIEPQKADSLKLHFIRSFTGSIVEDEQYWLYRLNQ